MKKKPLEYALYLLELRDRSIAEIRQKMKRKEYEEEDIEKTVTFLLDKDFLNDERFAENYSKQLQNRRQGQYKIKLGLQKLGLSQDIIAAKISNISEDSEEEMARELGQNYLDKKFKLKGDENEYQIKRKKYDKLGRFLVSRGYSLDTVKKILEELL